MKEQKATMWFSKYALTDGIRMLTGTITIHGRFIPDGFFQSYEIGKDAHYKREDALSSAEVLRVRKIESLHKQIKKLEKLNF